MIIYGTPHSAVVHTYRHGSKKRREFLFQFDENGQFETDDEKIIERCKKHFQIKEAIAEEPARPLRKCKKCDFTCETQGDLLKHYRENHPKEG